MPESDNADDHIARLATKKANHLPGCVTKHDDKNPTKGGGNPCRYRDNGYHDTKGDSAKRAIYEVDFTLEKNGRRLPFLYQEQVLGKKVGSPGSLRWPKNPRVHKTAWHLGTGQNFMKAYLPYNHNHHHILPFDGIKNLEYDELEILQGTGYNLNAGNNVIILPCNTEYGFALKLPHHPTDHPKYTERVRKLVARIKQKVSKNKKNHQLKKKTANNFKSDIETWQQSQFWKLVKYGETKNKGTSRADMDSAPLAARPARR